MRVAIGIVALLLLGADYPRHRRFMQPNLKSSSYALFEFAPVSGAGVGAACACTTPTGAKGEVMTFTRASSAWCAKSNETTGIAVGDYVQCASGQPRVMPGVDGTGGNGLAVWEQRTNLALRWIEFDNAAWTKDVGITVSANDATCPLAPDGTQTADLVTFAGANGTGIKQAVTVTNNTTYAHSIFVSRKTGGAACTLGLKDAVVVGTTTSLALASGTWDRMANLGTEVGTSSGVYLREVTAGDCVEACVWGGQTEQTVPTIGPPISTVGTSATRLTEVAFVTVPVAPKSTGVYSMAATLSTSKASTVNWAGMAVYTAGVSPYAAMYRLTDLRCESSNGTAITATRASVGNFHNKRIVCWNDGANEQGIYDGTAFATPAAGTRTAPLATQVYLGALPSGLELNGVVKRVCVDSAAARCR